VKNLPEWKEAPSPKPGFLAGLNGRNRQNRPLSRHVTDPEIYPGRSHNRINSLRNPHRPPIQSAVFLSLGARIARLHMGFSQGMASYTIPPIKDPLLR
jgi:hypothetical protein